MDNKKKFPVVPKELLEELEKRFPDRCPEPTTSLDEIRIKTGQVSVVKFLRSIFEVQNRNVLENK
jgi:hypothetical protein